jgi:cell division protease FtsH
MMPTTSTKLKSRPAEPMGPLELRAYKLDWITSLHFRHVASTAAARNLDLLAVDRIDDVKSSVVSGFEALRQSWTEYEYDMHEPVVTQRRSNSRARPVSPAAVVARLLFARLFDERPALLREFGCSAPVIVIDVADTAMLELVSTVWRNTLLSPDARVMHLDERHGARENYDVVLLKVAEVPKGKQAADRERETIWALQLALPMVAISPSAETHLSQTLLKAAPVRIRFPSFDSVTIARAIRVVTGKRCRELLNEPTAARLSPNDLMNGRSKPAL